MDNETRNAIAELRSMIGGAAKLLELFGPQLSEMAQAIKHLDGRLRLVEDRVGIERPSAPLQH